MSEPEDRGAIVEIIDPTVRDDKGPLVPQRVVINGTDVGYTQGIVVKSGGNGEPTTVILTLVPSKVIIRGGGQ